jgi:putative FmdB family regulatory protein
MPTYEYICRACGHEWEAFQSMKDAPLKKCPACRKLKAKRQISLGGGFILKGGGWYADLYSSTSGGASTKTSGGGKPGAGTSGTGSKGGSGTSSTGGGSKSGSGGGSGSGKSAGGQASSGAGA